MRITIHVTQEDIDAARENPHEFFNSYTKSCPVARSINKRLNESFWVDGMYAHYDYKPYKFLKLSDKTRNFIIAFDSKKPVEPISFRINVPKELVK